MSLARVGIVLLCLLALCVFAAAGESAGPSPLDGVDRRKVPFNLRPPNDVPGETLVQLGLRDGRWDTIAARPDGTAIAVSEPEGKIVFFGLPGFKSIASLSS